MKIIEALKEYINKSLKKENKTQTAEENYLIH